MTKDYDGDDDGDGEKHLGQQVWGKQSLGTKSWFTIIRSFSVSDVRTDLPTYNGRR